MKCPYCNKSVRDMPLHLGNNPSCHNRHIELLRLELQDIAIRQSKQQKVKDKE